MTHLKRINAPKTWPIERKKEKFIAKPLPGPHKLEESMPLGVVLRELLKIGNKTREVKILLHDGEILVNNKIRKEFRFPLGIFDTLSIPKLNKNYKVLYNQKGRLHLTEVQKEETEHKTAKIIGKTILKKGKVQLNLYDGTNLIVEKDSYKVRDSLILKENKITKHLKFDKDSLVYLTGGKHIGNKGKVVEIKKYHGISKPIIIFKIDNEMHETLADYAYVLEK